MIQALLVCALAAPLLGGATVDHGDRLPPSGAWEDEVELPDGLVTIDLSGSEDVDLRVSGPGELVREASSHVSEERLLVQGPGRVRVRVDGPAGARFRVSLTASEVPSEPLRSGQGLTLGGARRTTVLRAPTQTAVLEAVRIYGGGDLDLVAFDERCEVVRIAEVETAREELRLGPDVRWVALAIRRQETAPGSSRVRLRLRRADPPGELASFLAGLPRTPEQRRAIAALALNPDFLRVQAYLERYPGGVPLDLRVVPGLKAHGVERFGTYSQGVLTINPTKVEHRRNPQELVDTLVHELLHALLAMPRADGFPLADDVLDATHDPVLRETLTSPLRRTRLPATIARYLDAHYGPSASNPSEDFTDINAGAQRLLVKLIRDNLNRSGCGEETLVFENVRARARTAAK